MTTPFNENSYTKGKSKEELLNNLLLVQKNPELHDLVQMGIIVRCVQDLERGLQQQASALLTVNQHLTFHMEGLKDLTQSAQETAEKSIGALTAATLTAQAVLQQSVDALTAATIAASAGNDRLGRKLVALNWILAVATGLGAVGALVSGIASFLR